MTQQELKRAVNDWQLNHSASTWVDYYQNTWQYGINKKDRQRDYKRNGEINRSSDSVYLGETKVNVKYTTYPLSFLGYSLLSLTDGHIINSSLYVQEINKYKDKNEINYVIYPINFLLFFVNRNQHLIVETPNAIYKSYEYEITNDGHLIMKDYGTN